MTTTVSAEQADGVEAAAITTWFHPAVHRRISARRIIVTPLVLTLVFAASLTLVLLPTFGESFQTIPGDGGDMRLVTYVLEHSHQYWSGRVDQFWNAPFFYPHPNVLVLSENQVGAAPFYSLFRWIGLNRESSLQAWIITGFFLNYLAAAVVFRRLGFSLHLTALGACLFAFSVPQMLHLGHTQLIYRFPVPLAWYAGYRYLCSGSAKHLALCGLLTCWQFYITPYFGFFLSLALVVTAMVYAALHADDLRAQVLSARRRSWVVHTTIAVSCLLLLLPVLVPYSSAAIPSNSTSEVMALLPRLQSYLMGSRYDYLPKLVGTQWTVDAPYPWEHLIFPGLVPLLSVLVVWGLLLFRRSSRRMPASVRIGAFTLLVLVTLTLSVRDVSLYRILLDFVPPIRGFRGVTRISLVYSFFAALCVCWLLSLGFSSLRAFSRVPAQIALVAFLWLFSTWDAGVNLSSLSKADARARVEKIVSDVRGRTNPDAILVSLQTNPEEPWYYTQIDSMLAAQELGIRTMNGYSRAVPPGFSVQPRQCADVASMAHTYEAYVPAFRFEAIRNRVVVSPSQLDCSPVWKRTGHPPPAGDRAASLDYAASFEIQCLNCPPLADETIQFVVDVKNVSTTAWPLLPLALSGRLVRASDGEPLSGFDIRVPLGHVLEPGGRVPLLMAVNGAGVPGDYLLETDMVHEHVTWFSQTGRSARGRFPVRVRPQPQTPLRLITPTRIWSLP